MLPVNINPVSNDVAVSIQNLTVGFEDNIILNNLSLNIKKREILGVAGGSGSGKSVLLKAILGLIEAKSGDIHILGQKVNGEKGTRPVSINMRIGVLFQHGALFSSLNVLENIQVPMIEYLNLSKTLMNELAMLKLHMVGLDPSSAEKFPSELSGGMIKRVALARALALDPDLIFLDEPTAGLDPISAANFDELILKLRDISQLTVYMITHDLGSLFTACDRIAILGKKKVLLQGTINDMLESEEPWIKSYFRGTRAPCVSNHKKV